MSSLSWSPVFSGGGFCAAPVSRVVRGSRADCGFRAIAGLRARSALVFMKYPSLYRAAADIPVYFGLLAGRG